MKASIFLIVGIAIGFACGKFLTANPPIDAGASKELTAADSRRTELGSSLGGRAENAASAADLLDLVSAGFSHANTIKLYGAVEHLDASALKNLAQELDGLPANEGAACLDKRLPPLKRATEGHATTCI